MKKILSAAGCLLFVFGAAGVVHEFADWFRLWGLVHRLPFLDGYELFASIVLTVTGATIMVAADRLRE
ncbi:hypothetical protein [Streptomyces sp. NPDC005805]|uniref:hypothetical protein n=1 Tax=Streptomyces sp. NPDC005805 TaxID=3157068 RepID=UPI003410E6F8